MPWEHAVVGYVAYSLFVHLAYRDSPTGGETLVVVFASVLPDLIDKPLAWEYGVFESGYALGHSIFFAIPLSIGIGLLASARGRPRIGWAFAIGYILHLPADVIPLYLQGRGMPLERILWPVQRADGVSGIGFWEGFQRNTAGYSSEMLTALEYSTYAQGVFALMAFSLLLWIYDGMPVLRELAVGVRRLVGTRALESG